MKFIINLALSLFTLLVLMAVPKMAQAAEPCTGTYTLGTRGECVIRLQSALENGGHDVGTVDGVYGAGTKRAVANFQRKSGLPADGIAGPRTMAALGLTEKVVPNRVRMARTILSSGRITFWTNHVSGVKDSAYAQANIMDTAAGLKAKNSHYENAPGGEAYVTEQVLKTMLDLSGKYRFTVSELTGASHSKNSPHYRGAAFDVSHINGIMVTNQNPYWQAFKTDAQAKGAFVLGPGDPGHSTHIHVQF